MKTGKKITYIFFLLPLLFPLILVSGNIDIEKNNIQSVVNKFFIVLGNGDTALAKEILVSEGSNFSVREDGNSYKIKYSDYKTLIQNLPKTKGRYREVISNPKILVHKNIAVLWAKYEFFIDGKFSHCGVDSFNLIKSDDKWRIASIIYTIEKRGCR